MATAKTVAQLLEPSKSAVVVPIANKKPRPARPKRGQMTFLTTDETIAVLTAARAHSTRDWVMILLSYRHGLRASEVCGLKLTDINLKEGWVSIRRLKGSLQTVQPLYPHRGKPLLDETGRTQGLASRTTQ